MLKIKFFVILQNNLSFLTIQLCDTSLHHVTVDISFLFELFVTPPEKFDGGIVEEGTCIIVVRFIPEDIRHH